MTGRGRFAALALATGLIASLGTSAALADKPRSSRAGAGTANPSALVAAEIAFARAAREKGQWTAFRDYADDAGIMFVPAPVLARDWLKNRANPASAVQWEPYEVWMSCDGSLGVTRGGWHRPDGSSGWFTTVWKQQNGGRGKDGYLWVLDQGERTAAPLEKPEMLKAVVADCPARGAPRSRLTDEAAKAAPVAPGSTGGGASRDGTLQWSYAIDATGNRRFSVSLARPGGMAEVLTTSVAPEPEG